MAVPEYPAAVPGDIMKARNLADLRASYNESPYALLPDAERNDELVVAAQLIVDTLGRLGLDVYNMKDERIARLQDGLARLSGSAIHTYQAHGSDRPETVFESAYARVLSGADPESPSIRLRPLRGLKQSESATVEPTLAAARRYTAGSQYTLATLWPQMNQRTITDPYSIFWGATVTVEQFVPNITATVDIPTGILRAKAVLDNPRHHYLRDTTWNTAIQDGYVPATMTAYRADKTEVITQYDTAAGYVRNLLDMIERH